MVNLLKSNHMPQIIAQLIYITIGCDHKSIKTIPKIFHHERNLNLHLAQNLRNNGMPSHLIQIHMKCLLRSERLPGTLNMAKRESECSEFKMQPKVKIYCAACFFKFIARVLL